LKSRKYDRAKKTEKKVVDRGNRRLFSASKKREPGQWRLNKEKREKKGKREGLWEKGPAS